MAKQCTICSHPKREGIEELLVKNIPNRIITEKFEGLSQTSINRHRDNHFKKELEKARQELALNEQYQRVTKLEYLVSVSHDTLIAMVGVLEQGKRDEKPGVMALASSQIRSHLSLINDLARQGTPASIHYHVSPEWQGLQSRILESLEAYPEAKTELIKLFSSNDDKVVSIEGRRKEINNQ